jgi:hypothetical protein
MIDKMIDKMGVVRCDSSFFWGRFQDVPVISICYYGQ